MKGTKNIVVKKVCFRCHTFDNSLPKRCGCKCAVTRSCPGLNFSKDEKKRLIAQRKRTASKHKN